MALSARGVSLVLVAIGVLCMLYQFLALTHRYPLDYGEAPLVDQAMRLARGQNIYRADISTPPFTISNYPPLYVATMAPFVALFGPSFFFGRLISIVCAWVCALCLGLIVWQVTRDRVAALLSGLSFLAFPFVVRWSSFARIDLLALALSLAALAVLARRPLDNRRIVAGALLLVAAIYTRQSYALAAPLAAFVWVLFQENARRAFGLAAIVAGVGGGLFLVLNALTGGGFYFNVVTANANAWSADRLLWNLSQLTDTAPIFLALAVFSMALDAQRNPLWAMNAPYLVGSFLSFLTVGKVGSNVNYALELCAALSMAAGGVVAWARSRQAVWPGLAAIALVGVQVLHMGRISWEAEWPQLQARRDAAESLRQLEAIVAAAGDPVLADEYMGMLTLQGRPLYIQPFEVTQLALEGKWDQQPVLRGIEAKQYPLILIHYFPGADVYKERWTPQMLDAINRSYRLVGMYADTGVYQPIGQTQRGRASWTGHTRSFGGSVATAPSR
ncbi:MAG: glycosyltransferase family 39 protein [Anaerolineae bacterium]|nr:glycosyltransferase family 39 protein [Candidatus Roseilinea sp.]MDW8451347.1 glycosyltransferase family 39 protein [Anaerolineae bacterium]